MTEANIAIVGSGIAGLSLAHHLANDASVILFEKSRGVGGRMSTRYADDFQFDHGAQFFTARSKQFKEFLTPFIADNHVQEWKPKVITMEKGTKPYKRLWYEPHYIASPKMNSLCKALAKDKTLLLNTHIDRIIKSGDQWRLVDKSGLQHGPFDWVVFTAPAPQTMALLPESFEGFEMISKTIMTGCYSMMIGLNEKPPLSWDAAKVKNSPVDWIAIDSSKPRRGNACSILVQSSNSWAEENMEEDPDDVARILKEEISDLLKLDFDTVAHNKLHRWRFANTQVNDDSDDEPQGYYIDQTLRLAACGDWCLQGRVESAYLSAYMLASTLKQRSMF